MSLPKVRVQEGVFFGLYVLGEFLCCCCVSGSKIPNTSGLDCILFQSVSKFPKDLEVRLPNWKKFEFGNVVFHFSACFT